jgi:hypothetical protein
MHTNQEAADTPYTHIRAIGSSFVNFLAWQFVYLMHNQVPSAQVEVSYAEVHPLYKCVFHDIAQSFAKLRLDIVVNSCHWVALWVGGSN